MGPILDFARRHGLPVVEDCAQAHGARYEGRLCGTMGQLAAFSFYPTKNLGAYGDGGAVVTGDGGPGRAGAPAAGVRLDARAALREPDPGHQLPPGRAAGGDPAGEAAPPGRGQRPPAPAGRPLRRGLERGAGADAAGGDVLGAPRLPPLRGARRGGRREGRGGAPGGAAGVLAGAGDRDGGALPAAGAPAAGVRRPGPGGVAAGDGAGGGGGALAPALPGAAGRRRAAGGGGRSAATSSAGEDRRTGAGER